MACCGRSTRASNAWVSTAWTSCTSTIPMTICGGAGRRLPRARRAPCPGGDLRDLRGREPPGPLTPWSARPTWIASCWRGATRCSTRRRSMSCSPCVRSAVSPSSPPGCYNSGVLADPKPGVVVRLRSRRGAHLREGPRDPAAICERHDVPVRAAALQFPFGHPIVTCAVVGMRNAARSTTTCGSSRSEIPAELWMEHARGRCARRAGTHPGTGRRRRP